MPTHEGENEIDISDDIISVIINSINYNNSTIIAISAFEDCVSEKRKLFADSGVILVHYDQNGEVWRKNLEGALQRSRNKNNLDFIVVCALDKERQAFLKTGATGHELKNIAGLDCMILEYKNLRGACIKLPKMGLVNASIITARAIERLNPKLVAMSGICAGIKDATNIGALVVPDLCWEYQVGKWSDNGFKIEHYDVTLSANTITIINHYIDEIKKGDCLKLDLIEDVCRFEPIVIEPMASGSAVIASSEKVDNIAMQHRKIAALDMEMYGVFKASELSATSPIFFGAKTVVDLADTHKGDKYHEYGSILSARFVLEATSRLLR